MVGVDYNKKKSVYLLFPSQIQSAELTFPFARLLNDSSDHKYLVDHAAHLVVTKTLDNCGNHAAGSNVCFCFVLATDPREIAST